MPKGYGITTYRSGRALGTGSVERDMRIVPGG
jgi:hypothetical protein